VRGNPANLKPWPKGVSGNPGGRPKKQPITTELERLLGEEVPNREGQTWASVIAEALLTEAREGNVAAFNSIRDMVEGKPVQRIEESGPDGEPPCIRVQFVPGLAERIERARKRAHEK
jgi:hypothetical protein